MFKVRSTRPIIERWLRADQSRHHIQRHNAKRIYDRLKPEIGNADINL